MSAKQMNGRNCWRGRKKDACRAMRFIIAGFLLPLPAGSGKSALIKLSPVYLLYLRKSPRSGHERAGRRDKRGRKAGIGPESGGKSETLAGYSFISGTGMNFVSGKYFFSQFFRKFMVSFRIVSSSATG